MEIDIWLKRIWTLIGALVLIILLVIGVILIVQYFTSHGHDAGVLVGQAAKPKGPDSLVTQDLSFDKPQQVGRTDLLCIGVKVKELESSIPASSMRIMKYSEYSYGLNNLVNVIFTKSDGSGSYLLLNRKGFIKTADIPTPKDSVQFYNLYDIAFFDSDNDGRINGSDTSQLYISDLDGKHLSQVTPSGDIVSWYDKTDNGKQIFILIKQNPSNSNIPSHDWPERLFVYDIHSRLLSHFPLNDNVFSDIRKMVWEK
jgi:hypothetical protein